MRPPTNSEKVTYELGKTIPTNSEKYGHQTYQLGKTTPTNSERFCLPTRKTHTYKLGKTVPTNSERFSL